MEIKKLFNEPKIIGLLGMPNSAKSNLLYYFITELQKKGKFNLYHFGLRKDIGGNKINSVKELEQIKDSLVIIDEMETIFNLENRKHKRQIENSLRMIFHNNNILILCSVSENFKKFISAKCDVIIYKKLFYSDLINGSRVKNVLMDYQDINNVKGSEVLNLEKNQALIYDGNYEIVNIPYLKKYDSKINNKNIFSFK